MIGFSSDEVDQYLFLLRDLAWRVIEGAEDAHGLKKRLVHLLLQGYPSELQLPYAYLALLSHLLKVETMILQPHQMPSGAALCDVGGFHTKSQVPEPVEVAELGALWMILGSRLKNETLMYAGIKVALWQMHCLDHRGIFHVSLWSRGVSFFPSRLAFYNHLLFTLAYRLTGQKRFQEMAHIQKIHGWDSSSLPSKLLTLLPEKMATPISLSYRVFSEEVTVGMMKFGTPEWSMACTLSGWNSGFFSYHKSAVAIVNAAPHVAPLDAMDKFGIERTCNLNSRRFSDIVWDKTAYHFRLKGWTKIFALPTWMQIDAFFEAQRLTLSCLLQEGRPVEDLQLVFYVRCDQLGIGGKTQLQAGSLNRYQGKSSPIELSSGGEKIFIEPVNDGEMEIIPLAGGDHFWGAHFLVAFKIRDVLQFSIK